MRLVWTRAALHDLAEARAWIAADSPNAAAGQVARIVAAVAKLIDFPEAGRIGRRVGTRELVIPRTPFLIAYRVKPDVVEVLRLLHGAKRWPGRF
ncbi:MAG: type II toxin-antitoxin system RelE/ParE family toxin [bacterium]|nr:type II toxin-antitoxin system RelE/ParE family toxin [bacterium]